MDSSARITSKGQVTIPKPVRDVLDLQEGDEIVFRVERGRATVTKTGEFVAMAGSVAVPAARRKTPWGEVLAQTRQARAEKRH